MTASSGDQEGTPTVLVEAQASGLPVDRRYFSSDANLGSEDECGEDYCS